MSQTPQLDIPQISVARYLDLLKRRRWQVIPMSLLGLLIGGIVAFFIPRYYVATASIAYEHPPGHTDIDREDPFGAIIASAKLTIPRAIEATIKDLGWPESITTDPYVLGQNVADIDERLSIVPIGNNSERAYALIRVTYKDRDGERAAAFLNKLVLTWIEQRQAQLMESARARLGSALADHKRHNAAYNDFIEQRRQLQQTYRIQPDSLPIEQVQRVVGSVLIDSFQALADKLRDARVEVAGLSKQLEIAQEKLKGLTARVPLSLPMLMATAGQTEQGRQLLVLIAREKLAMDGFVREQEIAKSQRRIDALMAQLRELGKTPEMDENGLVPNPVYDAQKEIVETLEGKLAEAQATVPVLEGQLAQERENLARKAEGFALYSKVEDQLEQAKEKVTAANDRAALERSYLTQLESEPPIRREQEARVPPAPTEPNLVLVALLGCVIGLFAATGLVLLLDVLRGTFKTVEEVDRALTVPVLGGVSFLETDAQRREVARSRRRATIVAAAFLMLIGGVVLIYYFDPTRLPTVVRDMLSMVLGTA